MAHFEFTLQAPDGQTFFAQGWEPAGALRAVVCLIHGLGEHSGRYAHVAGALNAAGYAVLTFDLRGHGRTAGLRGHIPHYELAMDDIGRLLAEAARRYAGIPRFLYGHSLGGALVLNYMLRRRPDLAGVVVTSPGLRPGVVPPAWKTTVGRIMYRLWPTFIMDNGLDMQNLARDPAVLQACAADPLNHSHLSARLGIDILDAGAWALAHAAEFPPVPLLLMQGTADHLVSPEATQAFAAQVPGECTLKLWEGFYHETHNEPERAEVLSYVIAWLDAHG